MGGPGPGSERWDGSGVAVFRMNLMPFRFSGPGGVPAGTKRPSTTAHSMAPLSSWPIGRRISLGGGFNPPSSRFEATKGVTGGGNWFGRRELHHAPRPGTALLTHLPKGPSKETCSFQPSSPSRHRVRPTRGYEAYPPTEPGDENGPPGPSPLHPPSPSPLALIRKRASSILYAHSGMAQGRKGPNATIPPLPHDQKEGQTHLSLVLGRIGEHHPLSQTKRV